MVVCEVSLKIRTDVIKNDEGHILGSIITISGLRFADHKNRPYLAILPEGISVGQKPHKAFASYDAAREWLIRQHENAESEKQQT
jgi:hypothetical protein